VGTEPGLARRRMLALLALTLPAGCATVSRTSATPKALPPSASPAPGVSTSAGRVTGSPSTAPSSSVASRPGPKTSEPAETDGRGGPVPFRAGQAMLGSYLALGGLSLKQSLALRRRQLGRDQRIVHRFYPWDGYVPTSEPDVGPHSILMVSWHGTAYRQITDGSSDRLIASVARKLAGMKRPILLRWGWEMNGNWFDWDGTHNGQDTGGYVTAWRRLHRIFGEHGATNVAWVWCPNWNSAPDAPWNKFQHYYPGDDYVDWVGIDGYDFDGESPATLFTAITEAYGKRKPIIVSETAAIDLGAHTKARWIKKLAAWAEKTPALGAVVWFDTDIQPGTSHNFRPDTDAEALAAYRAMVTAKRFAG
jgi:Glycosyl hydrolase family 26